MIATPFVRVILEIRLVCFTLEREVSPSSCSSVYAVLEADTLVNSILPSPAIIFASNACPLLVITNFENSAITIQSFLIVLFQ